MISRKNFNRRTRSSVTASVRINLVTNLSCTISTPSTGHTTKLKWPTVILPLHGYNLDSSMVSAYIQLKNKASRRKEQSSAGSGKHTTSIGSLSQDVEEFMHGPAVLSQVQSSLVHLNFPFVVQLASITTTLVKKYKTTTLPSNCLS